ncbi:hypothetical protein [Dyella sp. S184]|uniref:hypothetical protein n=1 Tax=Dyella sp. S184 TaxID=1641862 RepID=UPI00131B6FE6|nr:hypothetical protein [Dyella sp. S184]
MKKSYAALIAPIILPALFFTGKMVFFDHSDPGYFRKTTFETLAGILPFSYLFSFIFGIPILFVLSKINKLNGTAFMLSGALGGIITIGIIYSYTSNFSSLKESGFLVAISAVAGLTVSLFFCILSKIPMRTPLRGE